MKISISKSGQSAKELSERHHEINNTFTFLDSHVKRGSSLQSFNVKLQSEKGVEDEKESATSTETSPAEISVGQMPQLHSSGEQSQSHQSLIGTFMARAGKIEELRKSLTSQNVEKKPQDEAADLFVAYLSNQLHQVSPNNWPDFTVDATRLVESCTLRNLHSVMNYHSHSTPYYMPLQNGQDYSTPPNPSSNIFKQPSSEFSDNSSARSGSGGSSGNVESLTFHSSSAMNFENL